MHKQRMEAFSDGVIAILITIMVLGLNALRGTDWETLRPLLPTFISYVLSFLVLGIYWTNHHHLLQAIEHVDRRVLWSNLFLLFWLSLIPFGTRWVSDSNFASLPVALYGALQVCAAVAYFILTRALIAIHGANSVLATALGRDLKAKVSIVIYLVAIPLAFLNSWIAYGLYVFVAIAWLVPDRRIEKRMAH
jgi:TMEM175 potassium channel family protein